MMMELSEVLAKKYLERQEARVKLDAANGQNVSLKEPKDTPEATKSQTYFGMSLSPCTNLIRWGMIVLKTVILDSCQHLWRYSIK